MSTRTKHRLNPFLLLLSVILAWQIGLVAQARSQSLTGAGVKSVIEQKTAMAGTTTDLSKKHVLILHAYSYETASSIFMDPIFVKEFTNAGFEANNLHFEFMDLTKHPDLAYRMEFTKYLRHKYENIPIDLIIALHRTALKFLVEEGKDLLPEVPVINVIADPQFSENDDYRNAQVHLMQRLKRHFVIMPFSLGTVLTVKSILNLQPDNRALVIVSGSDLLGRLMEQSVRRSLQAWQGRLQIEYLSGLPLEEVLERIATLAPKTAILYTSFNADPQRTYRNTDVAQRISKAANAPVFGLYDTLLGNGIVGGLMTHHDHEASRAVGLALEILSGRPSVEPITITPAQLIPTFDWGQLKRWGLNESRLPPGSVVLNRPKTIWTEHRGFVIGITAILVAQTLLVIGLLVQRKRKRKAESSLEERLQFEQFMAGLSARLVNVRPDQIDAEINQALGTIVNLFGVSTCILIEASPDQTSAAISHGNQAEGEKPVRLGVNLVPVFPWASKLVPRGEVVSFASLDDLPEEAAVDKRSYEAWGICSALTIPIPSEGSISYAISLSSRKKEVRWSEQLLPRLRLLGEIVVNCLKLVRANESLGESEERLSLAADSAQMGMWTVDFRTGTAWGTGKQRELFGFGSEEEVGLERILPRIYPEDREKYHQLIEHAIHSEGQQHSEFRVVLPDGSIRWISSRGRVHFSPTGEPERLTGVSLDITERKQAEEALIRARDQVQFFASQCITAQERERKLIAGEIHDSLGASLAATKFKVESALNEMDDGNPQARVALESVIPIIQGTMEEARRIQMALRPSMIDDLGILATINWFCRQYESTYPAIHIKREIDIEEAEVPQSLKIIIYRVLQEALNNVAKYSKASVVLLSLQKTKQAIQLVIQDNGQGFDLEKASSRKGTAKGLGLDSMRERTELSGGSFSIESSKERGTVIKATWSIEQLSP